MKWQKFITFLGFFLQFARDLQNQFHNFLADEVQVDNILDYVKTETSRSRSREVSMSSTFNDDDEDDDYDEAYVRFVSFSCLFTFLVVFLQFLPL